MLLMGKINLPSSIPKDTSQFMEAEELWDGQIAIYVQKIVQLLVERVR